MLRRVYRGLGCFWWSWWWWTCTSSSLTRRCSADRTPRSCDASVISNTSAIWHWAERGSIGILRRNFSDRTRPTISAQQMFALCVLPAHPISRTGACRHTCNQQHNNRPTHEIQISVCISKRIWISKRTHKQMTAPTINIYIYVYPCINIYIYMHMGINIARLLHANQLAQHMRKPMCAHIWHPTVDPELANAMSDPYRVTCQTSRCDTDSYPCKMRHLTTTRWDALNDSFLGYIKQMHCTNSLWALEDRHMWTH